MNTRRLVWLAGLFWVLVGLFLIARGGIMYQLALNEQHATQAAMAVSIAIGLCLGVAKGFFVLSKTAHRNRTRIETLDEPVKVHQVFSKPFYLVIAFMMLLGVLIRTWNELLGGYIVVAAVYLGIGMALLVGSRVYWKLQQVSNISEDRTIS